MVKSIMLRAIILYEVIIYLISTLVYGGALITSVYTGIWFFQHLPLPVFLLIIPNLIIVFILTLIFEVGFIRLLVPKMKEGFYEAPGSSMFYFWTLNLTLNRLLFFDPIKNIILYSATLRFFTFLALGAKFSYATSVSANTVFTDMQMFSVGKNSVIGAWTMISGHYINKGKLGLGMIVIGENVNIGTHCHIAPNVTIGNNTWVGAECRISPMVYIGSGCSIEPLTIIPPGTRINDGENYPKK